MQKLYLKSGVPMLYWETWESDDFITVHAGVLGQVGEVSHFPQSPDAARAIRRQAARLRARGYAEVATEALHTISIRYLLASWGSSEDLDKRHRVEELMNDCLGWTGLGHCDGGDIGSGDMNVCCLVVDPFVALGPILENLRQKDYLEGATIAIETEDDDQVLWPVAAAVASEGVTEQVLSARSLPNVGKSQQVLRDLMETHPDDEGTQDGFKHLSLIQGAAEEERA